MSFVAHNCRKTNWLASQGTTAFPTKTDHTSTANNNLTFCFTLTKNIREAKKINKSSVTAVQNRTMLN